MENLGRTLIKIKWQAGGESAILPGDIENNSTTDASRNSRQEQS
jgi:hypothetical protein